MATADWDRLVERIDGGAGMTAIVDPEFVVRALTPEAAATLGLPLPQVVGHSVAALVHPDDLERGMGAFQNVLEFDGLRPPAAYRLRTGVDGFRPYDVSGESFPDFGDCIALRISSIDERRRSEHLATGQLEVLEMLAGGESVEQCLLRLATLCEHYVDDTAAVIHLLGEGQIRSVAGEYVDPVIGHRLTGLAADTVPPNFEEAKRRGLSFVEHGLADLGHWRPFADSLSGQGWESCVTTPAYDATGGCIAYVEVLRSSNDRPENADLSVYGLLARLVGVILDRQSFESTLEQAANEDSLTGLGNRRALNALLDALSESGRPFGLLGVDLDQFSWINNNLGHLAGDALLTAVAQRFAAALPADAALFRHGGDEFMVIVEGRKSVEQLVEVAQAMLASLADPISVGHTTRLVQASIGIARYHVNGETSAEVLARADAAMYTAKREGGSGVRVFSRSLAASVQRRMSIADALRTALADGQFHLAYQPLFAMSELALVGAEALARWDHPTLGILSPSEFIPIAEETSFVRELDEWVLAQGQHQLNTWQESLTPGDSFEVWVNLSPQTLDRPDLVPLLEDVAGSSPNRLGLELTEREGFEDIVLAGARISRLRERGFGVAIDDFGTGRASLQHLAELDVSGLKIDRSFIARMQDSDRYRTMVETVVSLGKRLGLHVAAEGIEVPGQLIAVRELGCDRGQGYLMSRPVTPHLFDVFFDPEHVRSGRAFSLGLTANTDERHRVSLN